MNSDPYDSAAWRTFGMLDADESAIFDEAMRHDPVMRSAYLEMDRLSAAIAATTTTPLHPKAGQLERLQARLGLNPSRRAHLWLGMSGWAAAAVLALILVLDRTGTLGGAGRNSMAGTAVAPKPAGHVVALAPSQTRTENANVQQEGKNSNDGQNTAETAQLAINEPDAKTTAKVETKRLIQEIEVLRDNLKKFQHRDRVLFEAVPGMALPIVMTMSPPGVTSDDALSLAKNELQSPITAILGDALKVMNTVATGLPIAESSLGRAPGLNTSNIIGAPSGDFTTAQTDSQPTARQDNPVSSSTENPESLAAHPTAIPIYDAARDLGTLVISNLPDAEEGQVYNLWVNTEAGERPIYVGSLPESRAAGTDSFDFSLGSTMVLPSGFMLTKDPRDLPARPTKANMVLRGPPTSGR